VTLQNGTKDILVDVHRLGAICGFDFAVVVGAGSHYTDLRAELVDRLPK
jgi:hypothetical protein